MFNIENLKELTILVVDDNSQNIQLVHSVLQKNGYSKIAFASLGEKALELAKSMRPDLILLDIMMPLMDGYAVLRKLKTDQNTKDIPVIFLTAKAHNEDVVEGFRLGAVDYVTKPFENEILLARVQTHLMLRYQAKLLKEEKTLLEKRVETEVAKRLQSNAKFFTLYEQTRLGVSFLDRKGNFIDVNGRYGELLGYDKEEVLLRDAMSFTHPEDIEKSEQYFKDIANNQLKYLELEKRCIKKDGSVAWFRILLTKVENISDTDNFYIACICQDITKEVLMREELKAKEEMLVTQSRHAAMGNMIGMVAHQWRQPLGIIGMIANTIQLDIELQTPIEPAALNKEMDEIHEQVRYLSNTIEDFKNYFKPNKNKVMTKVDDVMEKTLNLIAQSLTNNNITIEKKYVLKSTINIFANELMQVFINILNNAKDALISKKIENPKIMIDISENENQIIVTIADNAEGIPQSVMDKIGNLYFSTKGEEGTGLGMYMSKTIVEKHLNGILTWENRNNGAFFSIILPK
jgi:PAS domain S-box-containing protein